MYAIKAFPLVAAAALLAFVQFSGVYASDSDWQTGRHLGIENTLDDNDISGCDDYRYDVVPRSRGHYVVQCTPNDGKLWLEYEVAVDSGRVTGPSKPR